MKVMIYGHDTPTNERLDRIVGEFGYQTLVCHEPLEKLSILLKTRRPEIALINASTPQLAELCALISNSHTHPPAIILLGKEEMGACTASALNACHYLLSPIDKDALANALSKATRLNAAQALSLAKKPEDDKRTRQYIAARTHRGVEMVSMSDVYYFAADQKYVKVRHKEGVVLIDETLKDLEEEFAGVMFRIHRSALVNLDYLDLLELMDSGQYRVRFRGIDETLCVSRRHLPALREKIHSI